MGIILKFLSSEKPNSAINNMFVAWMRNSTQRKDKKDKSKRLNKNKTRHNNN